MKDLLQRQQLIAEAIEKIRINFSKDSSRRKTKEYGEKRLKELSTLWSEFEGNHEQLITIQDQTDEYFTEDAYQILKAKYELVKGKLLKIIEDPPAQAASTSQDNGGFSRSDELISAQTTNFRAFTRLIRNIKMSELTEKWEIEDKLQMLQSRWKVIDERHWQIDSELIGANLDYEQDYTKHEAIFESTKKELYLKLNSSSHKPSAVPPIDIPTFTGNYTQWPTFMDLYSEAIHNNTSLTKAQKMQHLKGKLKGEAERIVQHLTVSAENYDTCWDILNHRYNNKQLLFTKQIETFMNQPTIQHSNSFELKRLHDVSLETIHAIHNLGIETTSWDPILVHILTGKLDSDTYASYMETRKEPKELPSFDELITFLQRKFTALEPINKKKQPTYVSNKLNQPNKDYKDQSPAHKDSTNNGKYKKHFAKTYHVKTERNCPLCKSDHFLLYCNTFKQMSQALKLNTIAQLDVCRNCMFSHNGQKCTSNKRCRVCSCAHHTSLHDILRDAEPSNALNEPSNLKPTPIQSNAAPSAQLQRKANHVAGNFNEVLLATVQLKIKALDGTYQILRCFLDQGSQIILITESAAQRLGLRRRKQNSTVSGIGFSSNQSNGTVQLECESLFGNYTFTTEALVMSKMLNNLPNYTFNKQQWPHLQNINLADPDYNVSRPVDILLDAGVYADIVLNGVLKGPAEAPIAQQTKLGWVLLGNVKTFNCHVLINNIDDIARFWEMEEITESRPETPEGQYCERLYSNTTRRCEDGRYEVKIPMKPDFNKHLGTSKPQAVAQLRQLEKRLAKDEQLSDSYKKFIDEYLELHHMKLCTLPQEPSCFLPHHGVIRLDSITTKLRVVFNASAKTTSGHSLNELMECGPNLQQDLQAIIMRWRAYEFVYTADIEKFYRQILIQEEDQHLQKIVWRDSVAEPIREYQLCTVTYGTKAAPFLAMRTIKQLVKDDGSQHPLAAEILKHQIYVDDLLGGSNTIEEAKEAQTQLINLLKGGGFNLRKWAGNKPELLENLPNNLISQKMLDFKHSETNKTLGIKWNPRTDHFTFNHTAPNSDRDVITKRTLLSDISKLYDPLGWLAPVTMKAKIIFQQTWSTPINWDDPLPDYVQREWEQFRQELPQINNIEIQRWMGNTSQPVELHGFCDASEKVYACAIYCKSTDNNGQDIIKLVAGKTKLAPLKKPISLPRLELCAAMLLSKLMKKVIDSTNLQTVTTYGWSDSMVVLGWLQGEPSRWKSFVSNRVVKITENMPPTCWKHVRSEDNPADCASRGLNVTQLLSHPLWWEGPSWLKNKTLPGCETFQTTEEERKTKQVCATEKTTPLVVELLTNHSSMAHVTRVVGWVLRFINNARHASNANRLSHLTPCDIENAQTVIIKEVQVMNFADDIMQLQKHKQVRSTSNILKLNPFLDKNNIMRVGGRLEHSNLTESQKHPVILPNIDKLTELLIDQAHHRTLHGGARLTLSYLRNRYWIIGGMRTVKKYLLKCVRCHRFKQTSDQQLMADLPRPRVTPSRPFTHTGVDFTGHVDVKANKGRGIKTLKAYIAVFICLCTKAIHLELVSDLSSAAFLNALKRFGARRGTPKHLYSDNGTNFVGAARTLNKQRQEALKLYIDDEVLNNITEWGIEWHFNAPSWPTAGGLWEAAVKSMKHYLKRVLGEQKLTFEEFSTLLTQIEACLNSRPLVALTDDVEDVDCLTPAHFLVGGPILAPPLSCEGDTFSLTNRWQLTAKMFKDFWKKWSTEYLQTLQSRSKWNFVSKNIETGDVVLVKEDNIPPAKWLLGKVKETHPGPDGRVRVVTLKTKTSTMKRPVTKLSRLPIDNEQLTTDHTEEPEQPKRTLRPRKTTTKTSYLCTLLMLIMMSITSVTSQLQTINVTNLNSAKLVYFDKIADMNVIQGEWKMVVYYNMTSYWQSLDNIKSYVQHLQTLCQKDKSYTAFTAIAAQLQHEVNELKHYNDILQTEHVSRMKRGLINGIGYLANSLFGVLDDHFAEKYDKDIKALQNNQNHLLTLYKQHTSIIEGEYNLLKRNEEVMNNQFAIINKHLQETQIQIAADTQHTMYITATSLAANMILANIRRVQQSLLDLVTDVKNGRADTHLLKPDAFEKQLNMIARKLPKGLTLPCTDNSDCVREMYKISRVHEKLTRNFLIFEVKIPLLSHEQQYELTKTIPIRAIKDGNMTSIIPTSEYMAVNLRKSLLMPMSAEDLTTCLHLNDRLLLCNLNLPIYNLKTITTICEANIINNREAVNCRSEVSDCKDEWVQLHSRESWLFACCEECSMRIFCPSGDSSQKLHNNGILTLPAGCMLQGEHHIIYSHQNFRSELKITDEEVYIPESGVNNFIQENIKRTLTIETHEKQLQSLHTRINLVKEQQESINLMAETADTHYSTIYSFIGVICIGLIIWGSFKITRKYIYRIKRVNEEFEVRYTTRKLNDARTDCEEVVVKPATRPFWSRSQLNREEGSASATTSDKANSPIMSRKPRELRGASTEPAVRKEPFTHLSEQELIEEANKVIAQASNITCTADHPPEKFFSLPHRRKFKEDRDRRNSEDAGVTEKGKSPLGRSTSDASQRRRERTSLSTLFRRAQKKPSSPAKPIVVTTKPVVAVKRSKSDVSDLKSNTNLNPNSKPIRKRSGSETEEFLRSLRNKKTQLSPIIESSPRDDYFKKTPPLEVFQKQKLAQKESIKSDDTTTDVKEDSKKKVNPIEKPPRFKTPEKPEPKPPTRTKRGKPLEKDKEQSPTITDTPKRKTDVKKTLLVDEIDSKAKDLNPVEVKERIKESIRKIEENVYGDKEMIHSSQQPPDKPPLTRGHTVDQIVRILKEDQQSPPPKAHLISPPNGTNVNQPFSYIKPSVSPDPNLFVRNTSPDRVPSPVNKMADRGVVYAHVVRDTGDTGSSQLGKQTVHKTYSPSREKYGNMSDEDEGLGYEDRHKYSANKYNYNYKTDDNYNSLEGPKITDSPIRPKFREYKLTSFDDFEPTYANEYPSTKDKSHNYIDTFRGRADGMDTKKKQFEPETKLDLDFNELSHRRQLLESRLNARKFDRERNPGEPVSRYLAETDPIYEAEKRMKATEKYVNETARYIRHTLERDGFAENSITEDYNRYDSDNQKIKYNTESRTFTKVPKGEVDRREFIDTLDPRYKGSKVFPPEPEYEPPSLEFNTAKHVLTPDEYKEKKYKVKKHFTSSQDVLQTNKYKGRDEWFGKRKGHYASNPEIAQEREDDYANIRYDAKHAESYHNSLRRVKNKDRYKEDYGIKRHDSGDSRDYYRDDRSPRRFDIDNRLVDSGIENDFRKESSGELHRKIRRHESDDDVRNTSLFLASERRHTEDNYPSEQIYANGEYMARFKDFNDGYRKEYNSRERSDDRSNLDPKGDRHDKSPIDEKVSAKPPKATKKLSGLEKVKQLFSRDSSKKSKKEKETVPKTRTRVLKSPEHLAGDDSDYRRYTDPEPSDIDVKKKEYDPEERRFRSSREHDRHRTPKEDDKYRSSREDLDRHRPHDDRYRSSREDLDRHRSSKEELNRYRSSKEDLNRYKNSREDLRYRSPDPRDTDVERKYRETDFDSRYHERTFKEDRIQERSAVRKYTTPLGSTDRDSEPRGSDVESERRKTRSRTAGPKPLDSPALAERYRERRRLATPSPTPSPPPRPAPTAAGNWFKSLDRLSRKKGKKDTKMEKESVLTSEPEPVRKTWSKTSKPLHSPAKNLRFFGDTDQDSDVNVKHTVTKTKSHPTHSTLRKTISNSSTGLDEVDHDLTAKSYSLTNLKESPKTSKYYKRNLQNISEINREMSNSETESQMDRKAKKPPISPYDRSRSHSSSKTLKGSKSDLRRKERGSSSELRSSKQELRDLKHRRRTPANLSGESSTEGDSSHQSQRSVVYLHATTVGDIPDPGHLSRNRSRDDVSSVNSSNLQVKSTTKSFSIFAPWTPRHYNDQHDVHYAQRPRRPTKERDTFKKSSSTKNLSDDRPATLQKNKSYSQTTLTRKPQNSRLTSSSTTLYRKPDKTRTSSVQGATLSRKSGSREKKSQSNEVLTRSDSERERISRSISMPKDNNKKAGWFKLSNKKKQETTRVR